MYTRTAGRGETFTTAAQLPTTGSLFFNAHQFLQSGKTVLSNCFSVVTNSSCEAGSTQTLSSSFSLCLSLTCTTLNWQMILCKHVDTSCLPLFLKNNIHHDSRGCYLSADAQAHLSCVYGTARTRKLNWTQMYLDISWGHTWCLRSPSHDVTCFVSQGHLKRHYKNNALIYI